LISEPKAAAPSLAFWMTAGSICKKYIASATVQCAFLMGFTGVLHLWDEIKVGIAASVKNGVMSRFDLTVKWAADRIEYEDTATRYEYLT
jgi:hypothetical protein